MSRHIQTLANDTERNPRAFAAVTAYITGAVANWLATMSTLRPFPIAALSMVVIAVAAKSACAAPSIEISFEHSASEPQKLVHAEAVFPARHDAVYQVFEQIPAYPLLHDWIRKTTPAGDGENGQEFVVEFEFPWPVGRQWSRVEVQQHGNTIVWQQVEGSIKANHGRISFSAAGDEVRVDYLAAIDIGLPELVTQGYKAQFVREFLTAACEQAATPTGSQALVLADTP